MADTKPRLDQIWGTSELLPPGRILDLSILGEGISWLPPVFWHERMFFHGVRDRDLRSVTGAFPATFDRLRHTHPIFVVKVLGDLGHRVCPCSSKNWGATRFIRKGCILEVTGREQDRDSFLVEQYSLNLPSDPAFTEGLRFMGVVPEICLECCD